ncbi:MAG: hypothetical protein ACTS5F_00480 [Candidatus Hodgkinia cicadicola]
MLIAYNAKFDSEIVNCELQRYGKSPLAKENWCETHWRWRSKCVPDCPIR